jgi:hypothetical protein
MWKPNTKRNKILTDVSKFTDKLKPGPSTRRRSAPPPRPQVRTDDSLNDHVPCPVGALGHPCMPAHGTLIRASHLLDIPMCVATDTGGDHTKPWKLESSAILTPQMPHSWDA